MIGNWTTIVRVYYGTRVLQYYSVHVYYSSTSILYAYHHHDADLMTSLIIIARRQNVWPMIIRHGVHSQCEFNVYQQILRII